MMTISPYASYVAHSAAASTRPNFKGRAADMLRKQFSLAAEGFYPDEKPYFTRMISTKDGFNELTRFLRDATPELLRAAAGREGVSAEAKTQLEKIAGLREQQMEATKALFATA